MRISGIIWFSAMVAVLSVTSSCTSMQETMLQKPLAKAEFEYRSNQVVVPVALSGQEGYLFLLDSAVDPSVIDAAVAAQFGLVSEDAPTAEAEGAGDGPGLAIRPASISGMSISGIAFDEFLALSADLSRFSERLEFDLAGILGYSFLTGCVTRIDYRQRSVEIAQSADALPPIAGLRGERLILPLKFISEEDLIPIVEIRVGDENIPVSVDTGSSLGVELYESAVALLGLGEERDKGEKREILGARGEAEVTKGELDAVSIGPFNVQNVPATFSSRQHDPSERMGNLGNAFLENFVLTLDYVEGRIILQQRAP